MEKIEINKSVVPCRFGIRPAIRARGSINFAWIFFSPDAALINARVAALRSTRSERQSC